MKKFSNIALILIIISAVVITVGCTMYNINVGPVSKNNELKEIEVVSGSSYLTLAPILKENNLIKSEFFYKLYIKIFEPKSLETCIYNLSEDMGIKGIINELEKGCTSNPDVVKMTVPEAKNITQIAQIAENITNNSASELIELWDSDEFISEVINKYWFITNEINKNQIRHPLEGYFFPSTYELSNKDVDGRYIAFKMLDQMETVLNKYKDLIINSELSPHELLTLSSIVEYEAVLDTDRPKIAGVFYNRLGIDMPLQSCATLGYAIDEWKLTYTELDKQVDSPYNTYYYRGLPAGPGGMPGEKSIEAVLNPTSHDYLYFMANVCDLTDYKTYFSKTLQQHEAYVDQYLTCFR